MVRTRLNAGPITSLRSHCHLHDAAFPSAVHICFSLCLMWLVRGLHSPAPESACFTLTHSSLTVNRPAEGHDPVCIYTMSFLGPTNLCAWELPIASPSTMGRKTRNEVAFLCILGFSACICLPLNSLFPWLIWTRLPSSSGPSLLSLCMSVDADPTDFSCLYCSSRHTRLTVSSLLPLPQCTQSTKGMLGRVVRSLDFHELCPPGTPKTTPMGLEGSSPVALSAEPSASVSCAQQPTLQSVVTPCPHFSRINKRDSLHSTNPAFRLASPSPSLSRAGFVLEDAPEVRFVPLPWERTKPGAGVWVYTPLVSFNMKVNLSKVWKHKIEVFFYHLFMKTPRTGLYHCLSLNLKAICHTHSVKLLICKLIFKSGHICWNIHTCIYICIKLVCSGQWSRNHKKTQCIIIKIHF